MRQFILLLLLGPSLFGQIKIGTYKSVSDSVMRTPEIAFQKNNKFIYKDHTQISCFGWYEIKGEWKINFDKLILTDSVIAHNKEFTKSKYLKRVTIYNIKKNNLIFYEQKIEKPDSEYIASRKLLGDFQYIE